MTTHVIQPHALKDNALIPLGCVTITTFCAALIWPPVLVSYTLIFTIVVFFSRDPISSPIAHLSLVWFLTFVVKYWFYRTIPSGVVGGPVSSDVLAVSMWQSFIYFLVLVTVYCLTRSVLKVAIPGVGGFRPAIMRNMRTFYSANVLVFTFSLLVTLYFYASIALSGGIANFLENRTGEGYGLGAFKILGPQFLTFSSAALVLSCFYLYSTERKEADARRLIQWLVLGFIACLALLFLEMARARFLFFLACCLMGYHLYIHSFSRLSQIGLGLTGLVLIAFFAGAKYWVLASPGPEASAGISRTVIEKIMVSFDSLDHLNQVNLVSWAKVKEGWLQPVRDALFAYVPRIIWPEKPVNLGGVALQKYIYPDLFEEGRATTYYSVSIIGEALFLLGRAGLFVYSALAAVIIGILAAVLPARPLYAVFYIYFLFSMFNVVRSGLFGLGNNVMNMVIFGIAISGAYLGMIFFREICGQRARHRHQQTMAGADLGRA